MAPACFSLEHHVTNGPCEKKWNGGVCARTKEDAASIVIAHGIRYSEVSDESCRNDFADMAVNICPRIGGIPTPPTQCDCGQITHRGCDDNNQCDSRNLQRICCSYMKAFAKELCRDIDESLMSEWIAGRKYLGECYDDNCSSSSTISFSILSWLAPVLALVAFL